MGLADRIRSAAAAGLELVAGAIAPREAPATPVIASPLIAPRPTVAPAASPVIAGYLPEVQPAPKPAPSSIENVQIITSASWYDYAENFAGWKLTPEKLAWVLRQADLGEPWQMVDAMEAALLNDGHARGLWEQRLDEVAGQTWSITAPPGDVSPESAAAAIALNEPSQALDIAGFIEHAMLGATYGYSYTECAWGTRADGLQVPTELVFVPLRRFRFDALLSRPHLVSESNPFPGALLERTPGSSWIRAETKRWRKQTQAGLLRTAIWWMVFKRMSVRDWLIFAEKFGIPFIIGRYEENANEATRQKLRALVDALGTEGRGILGPDARIEVQNTAVRAGGGGGEHLHEGITKLCNSEISKILTSATLTSEAGGPGSFALGQVHADQKHKLSLADARRIGMLFSNWIGREFLVRNNLVGKAQPPFLHIHVAKLSLLTDARVAQALQALGLKLSKSQIRERFEYREPASDDDTLEPPATKGDSNAQDPADPRESADPPDA